MNSLNIYKPIKKELNIVEKKILNSIKSSSGKIFPQLKIIKTKNRNKLRKKQRDFIIK